MKKRIISLVLAICMVLSMMPVAFAANEAEAEMTVTAAEGSDITALTAGDKVVVTVTLPEIEKFAGVTVNIKYDNEKFAYVANSAKSDIPGMAFSNPGAAPNKTVRTMGMLDDVNTTIAAGTVAISAEFTVLEGVFGAAAFEIGDTALDVYEGYMPTPGNVKWPEAVSVKVVKAPITSVSVTGVTAPEIGNTPDTTVSASAGADASIKWYKGSTELKNTDQYVAETEYTAVVIVKAASDVDSFADTVTFTGDVAGWSVAKQTDGSYKLTKPFKTGDKAAITPEVRITGWTYGQAANAPSVDGNTGNGKVTYTYKVKNAADSTYATTVPTTAGEYTVKATVEATDNYKAGSDTADFTIAKAPLTIKSAAVDSKTYDGTTAATVTENSVQFDGLVGTDTVKYSATAVFADKNAGDNKDATVTVTLDSKNYTLASATKVVKASIAKKEITITADDKSIKVKDPVPALNTLTYSVEGLCGNDTVTKAPTFAYNPEIVDNTKEDTYDIVVSDASAGDNYTIKYVKGTLTISYKDKQTIDVDDTMDITVGETKSIDAKVTTGDGDLSYKVTSGSDIITVKDGKVTANKTGTAVITVTAEETKDYAEATKTITVTVAPKQITAPTAPDKTFTYNGEAQTYMTAPADAAYTVENATQTPAGTYTVTVALKDKDNTVWADTKTTADKSFTFVINKASVAVPAGGTLTYNGAVQTFLTETSDYTVANNKATNAGEYKVAVTLKDTRNTAWADGTTAAKEVAFVINKATITITAKSYDIMVDDEVPALGADSYTITGLVSGETLSKAPTVAYVDANGNAVTPDNTKEGTYTIKVSGAEASENYTITYVNGKLTITEEEQNGPVPNPPAHDCAIIKFNDCDPYQWYHEGIDYAVNNGLMNGVGTGKFAPNANTTRAMIVTILWRLEGEPAGADAGFADVADGQWYSEAIDWAAANGIVTGYSATKFGPMDSITREQMAAILYRYADYKGYDLSAGENTNILSYVDAMSISEYAVSAMQWAVGEGLINGVGEGTLNPKGTATRAQVATILMRFCENVAK